MSSAGAIQRAASSPMIQLAQQSWQLGPARQPPGASKYSAVSRAGRQPRGVVGDSPQDALTALALQRPAAPAFPPRTRSIHVGGDHQRQQVGIGEITVVVRVFLAAHGTRLAGVRIEQHAWPAPSLPPSSICLDLPAHLVLDRLLHEAEGVEVLDLAPRAQRRARAAHRDVGVAAERALLHVAVADADPAHQAVQRRA
jgi:hypothetical protein